MIRKMHIQKIYFGAPGTGKSYKIDTDLERIPSQHVFRVVIHPEYSYSDFVGQLLPEVNETTGSTDFRFVEGPFTNALIKAYEDNSQSVYLILEEISRGNVSAIFGDLFQLLDRDDEFVSKYPIRNRNISIKIPQIIGDDITLPSNFNIIGTVNLNDQSVYPMDTAFKRRFDWEYISTEPAAATPLTGAPHHGFSNNPYIKLILNNTSSKIKEERKIEWVKLYQILNKFITDKNEGLGKSEDKQIGHYFIKFPNTLIENSQNTDITIRDEAFLSISKIIQNKLLMYLWQDIQGGNAGYVQKTLFKNEISSYQKIYNDYLTEPILNEDLNAILYDGSLEI